MSFRITFRANDWLQKRIEEECRFRGMTISEFIRYCVREEIKKREIEKND